MSNAIEQAQALDPKVWQDLLGQPFAWGGRGGERGYDCLGLLIEVMGRLGHRGLPDPRDGWRRLAEGHDVIGPGLRSVGWKRTNKPAPGVVAVMGMLSGNHADHVGVLIDEGRVLHAQRGQGVVAESLDMLRLRSLGPVELYAPGTPVPITRKSESPAALAAAAPRVPRSEVWVALLPDPIRRPEERHTQRVAWRPGIRARDMVPEEWLAGHNGADLTVIVDGAASHLDDELPKGSSLIVMRGPAGGILESLIVGLLLSAASYALQLIFAPGAPTPEEESGSSSPTFRLGGIENTALTGIPIPVLYGEHRIGGNFISVFFTADSEGRQVLNLLIALSHGPIDSIAGLTGEHNDLQGAAIPRDIELNGTWAGEFRNVRISTRTGEIDQTAVPGFNQVVEAVPFEVTLQQNTAFTHTTSGPVDQFDVLVNFPAGLFFLNSGGGTRNRTVTIQFRWRLQASAVWTSETVNWTEANRSAFTKQFSKANLNRGVYVIEITRTNPVWPPASPQDSDQTDLVAINEISYDSLSYPGIALLGVRAMSDEQLPGGRPPVVTSVARGRKLWVPDLSAPSGWRLEWNRNPAWVVLDMLTHPVYGGAQNGQLSASDIDLASFGEWSVNCEEAADDGRGGTIGRAQCDYVADETRGLWEVAIGVARSSWAELSLVGSKIRAIVRKPSTPVALFNMSNVREFSLKWVGAGSRGNVVEATYHNSETGYESDIAQRIADQASLITTGRKVVKKTLSLVGVTRPPQAYRNVQWELNAEQLQGQVAQWTVGIDAIHVLPGDVVLVAHDAIEAGYGGRVVVGGGSSVTLDRDITLSPDARIIVRTSGTGQDVIQVRTVNPATATTYTAGTAIPVTLGWDSGDLPQKGDVWAAGQAANYVRPFRIREIETLDDLSRVITAVNYDEEIYDDDPGPVETFTDAMPDALPIPDKLSGLTLSEIALSGSDGVALSIVQAGWQANGRTAAVDLWHRVLEDGETVGTWRKAGRFTGDQGQILGVSAGDVLEVSACPVSLAGTAAHPDRGTCATISIRGAMSRPSAPPAEGFAATQVGESMILTAPEHPDPDVTHYVVRMQGDAKRTGGRVVARVPAGGSTTLPLWQVGIGAQLGLWPVNHAGREAVSGAVLSPTASVPTSWSGVAFSDEKASGWPATKDKVAVSDGDLVLDSGEIEGAYETSAITIDAPSTASVVIVVEALTAIEGSDDGADLDSLVTWNDGSLTWDDLEMLLWEGPVDVVSELEPEVEIRTYDGSTWSAWRAYQPEEVSGITQVAARLKLHSPGGDYAPMATGLRVAAYRRDLPDLVVKHITKRWPLPESAAAWAMNGATVAQHVGSYGFPVAFFGVNAAAIVALDAEVPSWHQDISDTHRIDFRVTFSGTADAAGGSSLQLYLTVRPWDRPTGSGSPAPAALPAILLSLAIPSGYTANTLLTRTVSVAAASAAALVPDAATPSVASLAFGRLGSLDAYNGHVHLATIEVLSKAVT